MFKNKDKFFSRSLIFQENRLLVQCSEKYTFLKANHEFKDFLYWNFMIVINLEYLRQLPIFRYLKLYIYQSLIYYFGDYAKIPNLHKQQRATNGSLLYKS